MRGRALVLAASVAAAACGKKLPPLAPLAVIPSRVDPLELTQEGTDVVLRFPYPSRTAQGESLTELTKVTIYREIVAARPGSRPPPPPAAEARAREEKLFLARAERLRDLSRADLDESTVGSEVVARDSLLPLVPDQRIGKVFLRYGLTATRGAKSVSELSPLVTIFPAVPPSAPPHLTAEVEERRVCLSWMRPFDMLDTTKPPTIAGYAIYRRAPGEDEYSDPIGYATRAPMYVDESVSPGKRYLYTVRAAPSKDPPYVFGPPADEVLVDTTDVFAPPPPEGVLVLTEAGGNRVLWNPVLASDLAGYRIYRKDAAGQMRLLADALKEPSFVDKGAPPEAVYAVSAVDTAGNESARAAPAPRSAE